MTSLQLYLLDIASGVEQNKAILYLFGRTLQGRRCCIQYKKASPYFYVRAKEDCIQKIKQLEFYHEKDFFNVIDAIPVTRTLQRREISLIKVIVNIPRAVPYFRDIIKHWKEVMSIYEADIPYPRRFMLDSRLEPGTLIEAEGELVSRKFKVPVFEAETLKQAEGEYGTPKVLAFTVETYNPAGKNIHVEKGPIYAIGLYGEGIAKTILWKGNPIEGCEFAGSEHDCIQKFIRHLEEYQPDILVGFESDSFDLSYLKARAQKYKIPLKIGLNNTYPRWFRGHAHIAGITHIDMKRWDNGYPSPAFEYAQGFLQEENYEELERYTKFVQKKVKYLYGRFHDHYPRLSEYEKLTGQTFFECTRMSIYEVVETMLMKTLTEEGEIIPPHAKSNELPHLQKVSIHKSGIYKKIKTYDIRPLFAQELVTENISPFTARCNCCRDHAFMVNEQEEIWFCTKRKESTIQLLDQIIQRFLRIALILKDKENKRLFDRAQVLLKVINTFPRYFAHAKARWFYPEYAKICFNSVQEKIEQKIKENQVFYMDTRTIITSSDIDFDILLPQKEFDACLITPSERNRAQYALLGNDLELIGFDEKGCMFAKDIQRNCLKIMLKSESNEETQKALQNYLVEIIDELRKGNIKKEELLLYQKLTKELTQYSDIVQAVMQQYTEQGIAFGKGSILRWYIEKKEDLTKKRVKLLNAGSPYDPDWYVQKEIIPRILPFLHMAGVSQYDATKNQSTLKEFL